MEWVWHEEYRVSLKGSCKRDHYVEIKIPITLFVPQKACENSEKNPWYTMHKPFNPTQMNLTEQFYLP